MRLHRFYVAELSREHYVAVADERLLNQWRKVLRFRPGQEVILFDGQGTERLYNLNELSATVANLELVSELTTKLPSKEVTLLWSLLKKDKNDWVLQKATELGVSHLVPILAERSEKPGLMKTGLKRL